MGSSVWKASSGGSHQKAGVSRQGAVQRLRNAVDVGQGFLSTLATGYGTWIPPTGSPVPQGTGTTLADAGRDFAADATERRRLVGHDQPARFLTESVTVSKSIGEMERRSRTSTLCPSSQRRRLGEAHRDRRAVGHDGGVRAFAKHVRLERSAESPGDLNVNVAVELVNEHVRWNRTPASGESRSLRTIQQASATGWTGR